MLKTIKTTKQLRLDELIKYVWENDVTGKDFKSETSPHVIVSATQHNNVINNGFAVEKNDLFKVEIEEEIKRDTKIDRLVEVYSKGSQLNVINHTRNSINEILSEEEKYEVKTLTIYALIDGKLELIWERDNQ